MAARTGHLTGHLTVVWSQSVYGVPRPRPRSIILDVKVPADLALELAQPRDIHNPTLYPIKIFGEVPHALQRSPRSLNHLDLAAVEIRGFRANLNGDVGEQPELE